MRIKIYTAVWTPEDVEHGANDPEATTSETLEFDTAEELGDYLEQNGLTEPSAWPLTGNERYAWLSQPGESFPDPTADRYERTAHRTADMPDDVWSAVLRRLCPNAF